MCDIFATLYFTMANPPHFSRPLISLFLPLSFSLSADKVTNMHITYSLKSILEMSIDFYLN